MDRLIEWLVSWPEARVASLLLQDIVLCKAWCESRRHDPLQGRLPAEAEARIAFWQQNATGPDLDTEGRRHQKLLRELLDLLHEDRHHELDGDRAAFLWAAHELASAAGHVPGHDRVERCISPHIDVLRDIHLNARPSPGLAQLAKRILYCTEDDVLRAPLRETRLLAGIELPCRGPVLTAPCHLRLLGDVPDDCTVVVEAEGHCCVDGYVLGRVLARTHCEVRGNISGAAIVLQDDIRARSIINNAWVVAKSGAVHARNAQGPRLVFAGTRIAIEGNTMLGHYITREFQVRDEVRGGRVEVAAQATARHFQHLGHNILSVVLRHHLSCEDFGESTGPEVNRLLSETGQLKRRIRNFEAVADIILREAEHAAQAVLMYLLGGTETQKKLQGLGSIRNRLEMMNRLIQNLSASLADAEQRLVGLEADGADEDDAADFLNIDGDTALDRDLVRERDDVIQLQRSLAVRQRDRRETSRLVKRITEKIRQLQAEHDRIAEVLELREREFQVQGGYEKLLTGTGQGESKLQVLQKVLPTLRKQPPNSNIAARLMSGFVTLGVRNIERRLAHNADYRQRAQACRDELKAVAEQLGRDFHLSVPTSPEGEEPAARVVGHFDEGVKIYMGMHVDSDDELPEGRILRTPGSDAQQVFALPKPGVQLHSTRVG